MRGRSEFLQDPNQSLILEANRRREQEQVIRNGKKIETGERGGGTEIGRREGWSYEEIERGRTD